jgi:unsaturated chondroitin disaccharide hydrolase
MIQRVSGHSWIASLFGLVATLSLGAAEGQGTSAVNVSEQYAFAAKQYEGMLARIGDSKLLPRSFDQGELVLVRPRDWTSGFFPGSLWLLFEHTGDAKWRKAAEDYTRRLDLLKHYTGTHDLGFMLNCSYGNGWRLTREPAYREMLLAGAGNLAGRFNPKVGLIRSWDWGTWSYPVIIDNMMNLELLLFAHSETQEARYQDIAVSHANKTLQNHFRPDHSCFHVVDYDSQTGGVVSRETRQGFSDSSAWARGQAWGLYGYTVMHRFTRDPACLAQAGRIADFLISHTNLPSDKVPYWDLNAPGIPNAPRDASAAAIMASALLELSGAVEGTNRTRYAAFAGEQLRSLASPAYRAAPGENGNFLLLHCVGDLPRTNEVNAPLVYADYYFLEALARFKAKSAPAK